MSFPGEYRDYVRKVTFALRRGGLLRENIFYDEFFEAELARTDLDTYLQGIYHDESELIVVFLSAEYERKTWCGLEWRALRDIIKQRRSQDVIPLRFDATSILFSIDGYIDLRRGDRDPEEIADLASFGPYKTQSTNRSLAEWHEAPQLVGLGMARQFGD
jgi:hypothetical protein